MTLIDPANLPALLGADAPYFNVDCVEQAGSTNDELSLQVAQRRAASGSVLVADRQTAGKGRQGRVWSSDPAASLTFSLYWRFARAPQAMSGLSLAVGLGLLRGLRSLGVNGVGLKWPNDLLLQQGPAAWGKLAGVLIELSPGRNGVDAIIGIGINLRPVVVEGARTASVQEGMMHPLPERDALLAALLKALRPVLTGFETDGMRPWVAEWEAAHVWQGREVSVLEAGQVRLSGQCLGIDSEGVLWLETLRGREPVQAGDVSLRAGVPT